MKRIAALSFGVALLLSGPATSVASAAPQVNATRGVSDEILKDRILYRLDTDDTLRKYDIKVEVESGVATLRGDVATDTQKRDAGRTASIEGIGRVKNDLKVEMAADKTLAERAKQGLTKAGDNITDAWITTKVKWYFVGDDQLKGSDINVDTNDHVVTLKGTVRTAGGRIRAVTLAKNAEGVSRVVDQLIVNNTQ